MAIHCLHLPDLETWFLIWKLITFDRWFSVTATNIYKYVNEAETLNWHYFLNRLLEWRVTWNYIDSPFNMVVVVYINAMKTKHLNKENLPINRLSLFTCKLVIIKMLVYRDQSIINKKSSLLYWYNHCNIIFFNWRNRLPTISNWGATGQIVQMIVDMI